MCDFCVALALPMPAGIGSLSRETGIAFARSCAPGIETAIAFAGEKRAFLMQLSGAEVMVVSMVAVLGRALVMAVSRWSAAAVAEASSVSTSPPHSCLCAKKFALRTKYGSKSAVCGVLGEFFRENTAGGGTLGELFRARCGKGRHSDGFFVEKSCFLSRNDNVCNAGRSQAPWRGPGQPRLQRPKRSARPRIMRGRAATHRMLGRQAMQTTLRSQVLQASRAHFFSSVTRYTLVSRSWKPARWYRRFAASREGREVRSTVRAPIF